MYQDKFNCVKDNPYKTYCTMIVDNLENPTGRQLNMLPFGINHDNALKKTVGEMMEKPGGKTIPLLEPRPMIKIGYEFRNS